MYPIVSFFTVWFLQETTISKNITVTQVSSTVGGKYFKELSKRDRQNIYNLNRFYASQVPLATQLC